MAKILNIVTNPNEILRKRSKELESVDIKNKTNFWADIKLTMQKKDGVGLAAPQVGVNIRAIAVAHKDGPLIMLNPVLSKMSLLKEWGEEGCLSVPGIFGQVKRHRSLICDYQDEQGQTRKIKARGYFARILQHEIDHLNGILFIDKAKNLEKFRAEKK